MIGRVLSRTVNQVAVARAPGGRRRRRRPGPNPWSALDRPGPTRPREILEASGVTDARISAG